MYCATCNKLITSDSTSLLGHNYHSECLYCTRCKTKLWYKPFIKKADGKLFCENLCSEDILILPPINGNANSIAESRKAYTLKRKQSALDNLNLNLDEATTTTNNNNSSLNVFNSESQRFLSNAEILRRREQIKNANNSKLELNGFDPKANRKLKNKTEPFDYNRADNGISNSNNGSKNNNKLNEPFSYNFDGKSPVKDLNQLRLGNTSPFALFGNNNNINNSINTNNTKTTNKTNNNVVSLCDKCAEFIDDNKEKCTFNNQTFHKKCFRCSKCFTELFRMKKVLTGANDKEYYCEPCYSKEFGPKCPKCNEPIASYMLTTSFENKIYHKECFVCQRCKKYLPNEQYFKTGKMILCRTCL